VSGSRAVDGQLFVVLLLLLLLVLLRG